MTVLNPPTWTQNGVYDARNDRLHVSSLLGSAGATTLTAFTVAQEVVPSMVVTIGAGTVYVESGYATAQGYYAVINDAPITKTVAPSDPTNPRIDRVVARVYDSYFAGTENKAEIEIIRGEPAVSPQLPDLPISSIELARISVAAGATTIVTANIDNSVMPLASFASSMIQGGASGAWTAYTSSLVFTNLTLGNGTSTAKYRQFGKTVHAIGRIILGSTSVVGTNPTMTLPVSAVGGGSFIIGTLGLFDSGTTYQVGWARWTAATTVALMPTSGLGITATAPWTWATNDAITWNLTYEAL